MLQLEWVSKTFALPGGAHHRALDCIDLRVREHEIVGIIGGSGCGKSTLLRIVAGLSRATEGSVLFDGVPVKQPDPALGIVFQEPRLLPWLSVRDNVCLNLLALPRRERLEASGEVIAKVGLDAFADALPRQLSGGMAQRVALARALVRSPAVLLADEPFSALDSMTKMALQDHLLSLWQTARFTMIFVTHDVEEAAVLADRVVVMRANPGRVHEVIALDLPRPRQRTDPELQLVRRKLLDALASAHARTTHDPSEEPHA